MTTNTPSTDVALRASGSNLQVGAGHMQQTELALIEQQANYLAQSSLVPRAFKGKPADIFAVASIGREVGLSPMAAMQSIHIIEGKPTMSAQLMGALVRARGHSLAIERLDDDGCKLVGVRADTGDRMEYEFNRSHAQAAGLLGKGVWKAHFRAMALARCTSQVARTLFPDVLAGISYTPEEGADIAGVDVKVDAEGEVVEIKGEPVTTRTAPPAAAARPTTVRRPSPAAAPAQVTHHEDAPQGTADFEGDPEPEAPALVDADTFARVIGYVQQLSADQQPEFRGFASANGITGWKPDTMTAAMAEQAEAKLREMLELDVEDAGETEVIEPEPEQPADDLADLAAAVEDAQSDPTTSSRRRTPASAA